MVEQLRSRLALDAETRQRSVRVACPLRAARAVGLLVADGEHERRRGLGGFAIVPALDRIEVSPCEELAPFIGVPIERTEAAEGDAGHQGERIERCLLELGEQRLARDRTLAIATGGERCG